MLDDDTFNVMAITRQSKSDPFRLFVDNLPSSVAMFDQRMRYLAASQRWIDDYHLPTPLLGRSHYDVFPEIPARWKKVHAQALKGESSSSDGERFERADGTVQYVSWSVKPWYEASGEIGGIIATEDITAQKLSHEALKESEERFRALAFATSQVIWTTNPEGVIERKNPSDSWSQFTGQTNEQCAGLGWLDAIHPDDRARVSATWRRAVDNKTVYTAEYRLRRHDGQYRRVSAKGIALQNPDGSVREWVGSNNDITEREMAFEALREAHQQKDEFLATLGHELRTLATIKLAMDVMERDPTTMEKFRGLFARMQRQVTHLTRIVEDIFQVSRVSCGKIDLRKEAADFNEIITGVKDSYKAKFEEKGIRLNVDFMERALPLSCDHMRLAQAVGNLLDNAAKYTDRGGMVDLVVSRQADEAVMRVRDTGIGVLPEHLKWIFGLFNQMKNGPERTKDGIGIGLALASKLIELHGGTIEAKSEGLGKGSEFVVRLPLTPAT